MKSIEVGIWEEADRATYAEQAKRPAEYGLFLISS